MRRRWLRQDRGGSTRAVPVRGGREAGGPARAYHRPCRTALPDAASALCGSRRGAGHALAIRHAKRARRCGATHLCGRAASGGGHARAPVQEDHLPQPRPARHRRGAAVRGRAQGAAQVTFAHHRRPHPLRHPHPTHPPDGYLGVAQLDHDRVTSPVTERRRDHCGARVGRGSARRARPRAGPRGPGLLRGAAHLRHPGGGGHHCARGTGCEGGDCARRVHRPRPAPPLLRRPPGRRPGLHDDHRVRPGHPDREHDRHLLGTHVRARVSPPVARPGGAGRSASVRGHDVPQRQAAECRVAGAPGRHQAFLRAGGGVRGRAAGPRDPRRRQSSRRRPERRCQRSWHRAVHSDAARNHERNAGDAINQPSRSSR
mmetsp:Transcript_62289/g.148399  ORF Transcript_62289/g.148399 Transcript_62289/m.148399 type:complete len:372 (-) Transcript_62289:70-1185(-)